jgi:hypothetical protein
VPSLSESPTINDYEVVNPVRGGEKWHFCSFMYNWVRHSRISNTLGMDLGMSLDHINHLQGERAITVVDYHMQLYMPME